MKTHCNYPSFIFHLPLNLHESTHPRNLILKRYMDKGSVDEVNYYEFCKDVDIYDEGVEISKKYAQSFLDYKKPTNEPQPTIYNDRPEGIDDLLAKIRRKVKEQR